jgi:hypothetical protein
VPSRPVRRAGGELSWPRPTRPGDVLHVVLLISDIVPSPSRPGRAMVHTLVNTLNQHVEPVQGFAAGWWSATGRLAAASGRPQPVGSSKTSSVLVAVATRTPSASRTSPSANAIRRPAFVTLPTAVSVPEAFVTAFMKLTLISTDV